MDLLQLQSNIKRDPAAYREEFLQQQRHFVAELQVFNLKPSNEFKQFAMLVSFLAQVRFPLLALRRGDWAVLEASHSSHPLATPILALFEHPSAEIAVNCAPQTASHHFQSAGTLSWLIYA